MHRVALHKYWLVLKLSVLDIFEYRFDFALGTLKYAMMVLMIALVWLAVGESGSVELTPRETVIYFFFSAILYSLSNFHTNYIEDDIRLGALIKYLLKPMSPFMYYLAVGAGPAIIQTVAKFVIMLPLLWWLGYGFSVSPSQVVIFALYLPIIFLFSYTLFAFISGFGFWLNEIWAIRWALTILFRFLAGTLIPISFLPLSYQAISYWLPFQHLAYTPIQIVLGNIDGRTAYQALVILIVWTSIIHCCRYWLWHVGYTRFEGAGQ